MGTAVESQSEQPREERAPAHGASAFRIVKPGQGVRVRAGTAIGAGVLVLAGAHWVWQQMQVVDNDYLKTLVPVAVLVVAAYFIFYLVGRHRGIVDFMIATEGEMKKVNWSSRREVWGATKVVIITVLSLGLLLAVVDAFFMLVFGSMGVLKNVRIIELFTGPGAS